MDYKVYKNTENKVPLILSFGGMGQKLDIPVFEFYNFLTKHFVCNFIFFKDTEQCWYQKGIKGLGKNVEETADSILTLIKSIPHSKLITLGVSAGGFASILFGSLIHADSIVAFSPQTFIDRPNRKKYNDDALNEYNRSLYNKCNDSSYYDLKRLNNIPELYLVYGNKDISDKKHVQHLRDNITYLIDIEGKHNIVKKMRDDGSLLSLLKKVINDTK